jgi:dTDP-4-amino-4,6-dideoxy-D-galactose acyltransferase
MNKLFVLQKNANPDYQEEVNCSLSICEDDEQYTALEIENLTIEYLMDNHVDVIISTQFPLNWYLIVRGLNIVTIIFGELEANKNLADIVIDFKNGNNNHFFTGPSYSICNNRSKEAEFKGIFNLVKKLEWDSDFFDFNVAYTSSRHLTDNILHHMNQFVKNENIQLVEYLCNCHDSRSVLLAEKNRFHFTDIRLTFEKQLNASSPYELNSNFRIGLAKKEHIPELREISGNIYKDSRYYFDGNFSDAKIDEFYRNWVEKAVLGNFDHECYTVFDGNIPAGFCTIRYRSAKVAQIGLFGISSKYQGRGLAISLIQAVNNILYKKGVGRISVVTQGRNYAAQRIYQKAGFLTKSTELWYHKWFK